MRVAAPPRGSVSNASRVVTLARGFAREAAAAARGFLRGFLGLASPAGSPAHPEDGPATAASARAALVRRAERRPTCC
jgi:hypothetical protein